MSAFPCRFHAGGDRDRKPDDQCRCLQRQPQAQDDQLVAAVRSRNQGPYSESLIEADLQAIRQAYAAIGREDVTVTTQTVPVGDGRVNLAFVINEGGRTRLPTSCSKAIRPSATRALKASS